MRSRARGARAGTAFLIREPDGSEFLVEVRKPTETEISTSKRDTDLRAQAVRQAWIGAKPGPDSPIEKWAKASARVNPDERVG